MSRYLVPFVAAACFCGLFLASFGEVLSGGRQFGYRDAGHFYYPLHQRIQQEWEAGRVPLWEPEENGGMPLLGNPSAAVLYPGKLVYAVLPYPAAARWYVILHVVLAAATMFGLMRSWGVSAVGSSIAASSFAFGTPVLFQYCNIIFLVGAAWMPLGIFAADRWVRLGSRWGLVILAIVLAMQTLGGDPQAAYVLGLSAAGYALGLAVCRASGRDLFNWRVVFLGLVAITLWIALTLLAARMFPRWMKAVGMFPWPAAFNPRLKPWPSWVPASRFPNRPGLTFLLTPWLVRRCVLILWLWVLGAAVYFRRRVVRSERRSFLSMAAGLVLASVAAFALMGAQMLPTLEYTGRTIRAADDGSHEIFPFSLEPARIVELAYPYLLGSSLGVNRSWLPLIPPAHSAKVWIPVVYCGGLTLILALAAIGLRKGPPWRVWLSAIAILSLLLSLGECASPLWAARGIPSYRRLIGPHDPPDSGENRRDGFLPDGVGSPYWAAAWLLPGFHTFRYPSKFLVFTSLALAGLAGAGWDRVIAGARRRPLALAVVLLAVSGAGLAGVISQERAILRTFQSSSLLRNPTAFGPFDAPGAIADAKHALLQGLLLAIASCVVIPSAVRWPKAASALALLVVAVDLGFIAHRLVDTVPQRLFETPPEALEKIREAERRDPSDGPYRIHRMPTWVPGDWTQKISSQREAEFVQWERGTLQPKYGIPDRVEYAITQGTAELYDYWFFFAPFYGRHDESIGRAVGLKPGERAVYFPRRGFDLWGARYFLLPAVPGNDEQRGIVAFLPDTKPVYPKLDPAATPGAAESRRRWRDEADWQLLRNTRAFPRAWVVRQARFVEPIRGMSKFDRAQTMEELLYQADAFWNSPGRVVYDPRTIAWVETEEPSSLTPYLSGAPSSDADKIRFKESSSQRVEVDVQLDKPGLVILADVYYPGWKLTIDGHPAPILRVNRMMRGAAVKAGSSRLVYTYDPDSFRWGTYLSTAGLVMLAAMIVWAARQERRPVLEPI